MQKAVSAEHPAINLVLQQPQVCLASNPGWIPAGFLAGADGRCCISNSCEFVCVAGVATALPPTSRQARRGWAGTSGKDWEGLCWLAFVTS